MADDGVKLPPPPPPPPPKVEPAPAPAPAAATEAASAAPATANPVGASPDARAAALAIGESATAERGLAGVRSLGGTEGSAPKVDPPAPAGEDKAPGAVTDGITGVVPPAKPSVDAAAAAFKSRVDAADKARDPNRERLAALEDHRKDLESRPASEAMALADKTADDVVKAATPLLKNGGGGNSQAAINALSGIAEQGSGATAEKLAAGVAKAVPGIDNSAGPQLYNAIKAGHGTAFGEALADKTGSRNIARNVANAQEPAATPAEAARTVAEVAPVTGTAISAAETISALKNGDFKGAAIAALGLIPFAKLGGKVAKAELRTAAKTAERTAAHTAERAGVHAPGTGSRLVTKTTGEFRAAVEPLGYKKMNGVTSKGQPVFENPKPGPGQPRYISRDAGHEGGSHNGGFAKSTDKYGNRTGTYELRGGRFEYLKP